MKKFFVFLTILLVVLAISFTTVYLLRDDEAIVMSTQAEWYNQTDPISLDFKIKNKKKSSKVIISSLNSKVVEVKENGKQIIAKGGGKTRLVLTLKNARGKTRTVEKPINIGDGSEENPFYIKNETDLRRIGADNELVFTLEKHYRQIFNIQLTEEKGAFKTIGDAMRPFEGSYNGAGNKIEGYVQDYSEAVVNTETSAMFHTLASTAKVGFIVFDQVDIKGPFQYASVVTAVNHGYIDYVKISGSIENTYENVNALTASVACVNQSKTIEANEMAIISRCENLASLTTKATVAGGIAAENYATIANCINGGDGLTYGNITLGSAFAANREVYIGGIAAKHIFDNLPGNPLEKPVRPIVKNSISVGTMSVIMPKETSTNTKHVGGIIGYNSNKSPDTSTPNYIFGNYYETGTFYVLEGFYGEETLPTETALFGVSNMNATNPETTEEYIAIGLQYNTLTSFEGNGEEPNILVSYFLSAGDGGSLISWNEPQEIWLFRENNYPRLLPTDFDKIIRLPVDLPRSVAEDDIIRNAFDWMRMLRQASQAGANDFTGVYSAETIYYIADDIDFDTRDKDIYPYYSWKDISGLQNLPIIGTVEKPVKATFIAGERTQGSRDYYTMKNFKFEPPIAGENIGLFGVVEGAKFEHITFDNFFIGGTEAENTGLIAGVAKNTEVLDCHILSNCVIESPSNINAKTVGGFFGMASGRISASSVQGRISGTAVSNLRAGGFAGIFGDSSGVTSVDRDTDSQVNNVHYTAGSGNYIASSFVNIDIVFTASEIGTSAGGAVGTLYAGAVLSHVQVRGSISATHAGGFACYSYGIIEFSETGLSGTATAPFVISARKAGGAVHTLHGSAVVFNSRTHTEFTDFSGAERAGFAMKMERSTYAKYCILITDFKGSGKNYAKTENVAAQRFAGDGIGNEENRGSDAGVLYGVFYVNKVNGSESNNADHTVFYRTCNSVIQFINDIISGNKLADAAPQNTFMGFSVNGRWGTGRVNSNGNIVTSPTGGSYSSAGFNSDIWSMSGLPVLK